MRLLSVVMKAETSDLRSKDTVNMLNYGFNTYKLDILLSKDKELGETKIEKAKITNTKLYSEQDVTILKKMSDDKEEYEYNLVVNDLKAPLKKNDVVGYLEILDQEGNIIKDVNVIVKEDIEKASLWNLWNRLFTNITSGTLL